MCKYIQYLIILSIKGVLLNAHIIYKLILFGEKSEAIFRKEKFPI